jgi:hypothetical protein
VGPPACPSAGASGPGDGRLALGPRLPPPAAWRAVVRSPGSRAARGRRGTRCRSWRPTSRRSWRAPRSAGPAGRGRRAAETAPTTGHPSSRSVCSIQASRTGRQRRPARVLARCAAGQSRTEGGERRLGPSLWPAVALVGQGWASSTPFPWAGCRGADRDVVLSWLSLPHNDRARARRSAGRRRRGRS